MAARIRLRRGSAATWTSVDPTLAVGEVGIESDTAKAKAGDGSTAWSSLPYLNGAEIDDLDARVTVLESRPIGHLMLGDWANPGTDTDIGIIIGMQTAVALTTVTLSADTIYAVLWSPPAQLLDGTWQLDAIQFLTTADGHDAYIGVWEIEDGRPTTLIGQSGELGSTGLTEWSSPSLTLDPTKLYAVGLVVDTGTTVRAVSNNAAFALGLDASMGTSAYTHFQGAHTYGSFSGFPEGVSASVGPIPAFRMEFSVI